MTSIGVIGCGVVGLAVAQGFESRGLTVYKYDKFKNEFHDLPQIFNASVIFVCVPTPTGDDDTQDLSALRETMALLRDNRFDGVVCVKSTVLPGMTELCAKEYGIKRICHNPEFLTAAKPFEDFMAQPAILIGGETIPAGIVAGIYQVAGFSNIRVLPTARNTELAKYMHNLFLSAKVSFFNEMYDACRMFNVNYEETLEGALAIGQIGRGHTKVPGPDGERGFGGMCFTKDTTAFLSLCQDMDLHVPMLHATVESNVLRRPYLYKSATVVRDDLEPNEVN